MWFRSRSVTDALALTTQYSSGCTGRSARASCAPLREERSTLWAQLGRSTQLRPHPHAAHGTLASAHGQFPMAASRLRWGRPQEMKRSWKPNFCRASFKQMLHIQLRAGVLFLRLLTPALADNLAGAGVLLNVLLLQPSPRRTSHCQTPHTGESAGDWWRPASSPAEHRWQAERLQAGETPGSS